MKASVLQEDLQNALSAASRFVSSRAQLPVLSNILFSVEKGKLVLSATNLEMGISLTIGAKTENEGKLTVPAKMVVDMISNVAPGRVEVEEKAGSLVFSSGGFTATLAGIPASEFPSLPSSLKGEGFSLEKEVLKELSQKVAFSASGDESRPVLTGVLLFFNKSLTAVATDGFRLSHKVFKLKEDRAPSKDKKKVLVPARAIEELARLLEDDTVRVALRPKEGQVLFGGDSVLLTGRILEGEFPDYEKIMPGEASHKASLAGEDFLRAVKAAAVFARESSSILRVAIEKGKLVVKAESQQFGREQAEVDAKTEGGELEVAFNYRYLLDFLASVEGDEVSFATEGPTSPALFQDPKDPSYKHLIMPVRIQS